jgi:hypothetical protein
VLVIIGPVASVSALAWLGHVRKVTKILRGDVVLPFDVPWDVIDRFESACDEWWLIADSSDVFRWSGEIETKDLELIVRYWFNVA